VRVRPREQKRTTRLLGKLVGRDSSERKNGYTPPRRGARPREKRRGRPQLLSWRRTPSEAGKIGPRPGGGRRRVGLLLKGGLDRCRCAERKEDDSPALKREDRVVAAEETKRGGELISGKTPSPIGVKEKRLGLPN